MVAFARYECSEFSPQGIALMKCVIVQLHLTRSSLVLSMNHLCLHGLQALCLGSLFFQTDDKYWWTLAKENIAPS